MRTMAVRELMCVYVLTLIKNINSHPNSQVRLEGVVADTDFKTSAVVQGGPRWLQRFSSRVPPTALHTQDIAAGEYEAKVAERSEVTQQSDATAAQRSIATTEQLEAVFQRLLS